MCDRNFLETCNSEILVEVSGIEPLAFRVQNGRSTN